MKDSKNLIRSELMKLINSIRKDENFRINEICKFIDFIDIRLTNMISENRVEDGRMIFIIKNTEEYSSIKRYIKLIQAFANI